MHARTKIRNALVGILNNIDGLQNVPVFGNPVLPIEKEEFPCIIVHTAGESIEYETPSYPRLQVRTLTVHITAVCKATSNYEELLDDFLLKVEDTLGKEENKTLGGLINYWERKDDDLDFDPEEQVYAQGRLSIELTYRTLENDNSITY